MGFSSERSSAHGGNCLIILAREDGVSSLRWSACPEDILYCVLAYRRAISSRGIMSSSSNTTSEEYIMGKYFLAWILGVPAIVLVLIYMFFR
jgi:hypothetical protein